MNQDIINKVYPSKVLLFGEYTVIHGGDSLAIPLYKKTANWDYDDIEFESRESLDAFVDYLVVNGIGDINFEHFSREWNNGLFLESNIPSGYGAGSSGSVVAAIYDCFMKHKTNNLDELRAMFVKMENHFHGTSSGIDPLVSYLGKTLHLSDGKVNVLEGEYPILDKLYLWDSGNSRKTAPLVEWYNKNLEKGLRQSVNGELAPLNQHLINAFIISDSEEFKRIFKEVERFELNYFIPMFPHSIKQNLNRMRNDYGISYKLCGAGGGGFYLIYSENKSILNEPNVIPLSR